DPCRESDGIDKRIRRIPLFLFDFAPRPFPISLRPSLLPAVPLPDFMCADTDPFFPVHVVHRSPVVFAPNDCRAGLFLTGCRDSKKIRLPAADRNIAAPPSLEFPSRGHAQMNRLPFPVFEDRSARN